MKNFKKNEKVYLFKKGKIINHSEIRDLSEEERMHLDKIGNDQYEIIEFPGCYINHSCNPNVEEKDRIGYALRDIKAGEEITINYDKSVYLERAFECQCGSSNCKKFIKGKVI